MELREYWRIIRKRLLLILAIPLIAGVASVYTTFKEKPPTVYAASATVLMNVGSTLNMPDTVTMNGIFTSQVFTKAVSQGFPALSVPANQLAGMINISTMGDLLSFTATAPSASLAADVANAFAETLITQGQTLGGLPSTRLLDLASSESAAIPADPSKKSPVIMAIAIGLLVGLALVLMLEYLDMRLTTETDMTKYLKIPVLGSVDDFGRKGRSKLNKLK